MCVRCVCVGGGGAGRCQENKQALYIDFYGEEINQSTEELKVRF